MSARAGRRRPKVIVMCNYKGGSGKTTTAAYLIHALRAAGLRPLGVDSDPQGSLLRWAGLAEWEIPVIGMAVPTLHRQIWGSIDPDRYDTVVIDTPPFEQAAGVVVSALRVASDIIVPLAPTTMELDRLGPVWGSIDDEADHPDRSEKLRVAVLLNRTHGKASATGLIREVIGEQGRRVLGVTVPSRVGMGGYGQAFGAPVPDDDPAHQSVVAEIRADWPESWVL